MNTPKSAGAQVGLVARLARTVIAHRRLTLIAWVAILVVVTVGSKAVGTREVTNLSASPGPSPRTRSNCCSGIPDPGRRRGPGRVQGPRRPDRPPGGRVPRSRRRSRGSPKAPHVTAVDQPLLAGGRPRSPGRQDRLRDRQLRRTRQRTPEPRDQQGHLHSRSARSASLQVELGGQAIQQASRRRSAPPPRSASSPRSSCC